MESAEELRFGVDDTHDLFSDPFSGASTDESTTASGLLNADELDPTFHLLLASVLSLPAESAIATIGRYGRILAAAETEIIAKHQASGATPRDTERLIGNGGKRSKRDRKKRAKRGETLRNNPDLKDDLEDGTVSEEQLDDLAHADSKTDGAASKNPELLDEVRNSNPDQSKSTIKEFVDNHNRPDTESKHQRQRRLRNFSRFTTKDGLEALLAVGDKATIDAIWSRVRDDADTLYKKDGGREVPPSEHPRSHAQRLFDAFAGFFDGNAGATSGSDSGGRNAARTGSTNGPAGGGRSRPTIVIGAMLGHDGEIVNPELIGSGPLPRAVFDRYFCNASIVGVLFGSKGQPLWQGRKYRHATPAQHVALVARDKGCVLCRAAHQNCEAHHLTPWNAPARGRTNIDELALLCPDCHHLVHDTNQTLFQDAKSRWKLRPARPEEIAPKRKPEPPPNRGQR